MNSLAHFSIASANSSADADTTRRAKRRSLLPQFSRKTSNDASTGGAIAEETEEDHANVKSSARRSSSETSRGAGGQSEDVQPEAVRRQAIDEDRRAMPPPGSRLSRPASMIPPRRTSISKIGKGHVSKSSRDQGVDVESARADSLAALTGSPSKTQPEMDTQSKNLKRAGSTRLPQSPRPGMPTIPSRTTSNRNMEGISRKGSVTLRENHARGASTAAGSTSMQEKRSSVAKARPQSIVGAPADTGSAQTSPQRANVMGRGRPASHLPPPKPAFNTFQQHYSPAKQSLPKPPIPASKSVRASATLTEEEPVSLDVAKHQIELLQLSLLHQTSAQCSAEYDASAKRKLGRKHAKLRKEYEAIRATELVHQRALNLASLESWCSDPTMLIENLQILSLVHSDLEALTEEGSRHAELVKKFERWFENSQDPANLDFVQSLPEEWHNTHSSLALKARSIQRNLGVLRPPERSDEPTALETVLKGCKSVMDGLLKELDLMSKLEKEILAKETAKVEEQVRALVLDDTGMSQAQPWIPAWGQVS